MQIRRIAISDFRKIKRREVTDLADGLNILVGDNEAGKSTMLAALRAAFFERHRVGGGVAEAMLPYGATVRPTVAVDFELDGKPWSLVKSFVQRPEASLQGPGERHMGDAVEDRLAELFGFTPPGRGGSNPKDHHGTHGLLWVEQGLRSNLGVGAGRDTLAGALEREVGQVTGGERGRALLAAAEERRDRFWDKRDRPRGPAVEARRHLEQREGEQAGLLLRQREMEDRLTRLESINVRLERHRRDDHLGRTAAAVAAAAQAMQEAARRRAAHEAALVALREAERGVGEARERRDRRQALVAKRDEAHQDLRRAETAAEESWLLARQRAFAVAEADAALSRARDAHKGAEDRLRSIEAAQHRQVAETALEDRRAKLIAAEEQAARHREASARVAAIGLDLDAVTTLTTLERAADRARAELDAAGLRVTFRPEGERRIVVDGAALEAGQPLSLTRDATLHLEGFGRLHVQPGGGTAALLRKCETAGRALDDALARAGVDTVSEARRQAQIRAEAQAEAAFLATSMAALAPKGLEPLRQAVGDAEARLARLAERPVEVPEPDALTKARHGLDEARIALQAAERDGKAAAAAQQAAALEAATLTERRDNARRQAEVLTDDVSVAREASDDDLLASRLAAAAAALVEAQASAKGAAAALQAADPETAQLTLERAETAEREIRRDLNGLEAAHRELRIELRALGQDGISERLSAIDGEIGVARSRLEAVEREAAASRLLHDTLLATQRESKERWLGPVRARVAPYLRLIHPDTEIRMDDRTLEIEGLYRDGVLEDFGSLSMGAREQVAVVTRLALADILRGAGHPAVVILDDALVNTDDARLERMRNVLTRAARGLQILIFTCRERDFLGLGATHRI